MFDYIYQKADCRCQFFKMPMSLFTDDIFTAISNEAKLLYGLLLDRTGLSLMNDWTDENGRVYINFTNAEVCRMLRIGAAKAVKVFKELVMVGLIERIRIGLGKPDRIFVKHIAQPEEQPCDVPEFEPEEVTFDTETSACSDSETQEFSAAQVSHNNNQNNRCRTIQSNLSGQREKSISPELVALYRQQIKENIEYDWFAECYADRKKIGGSQEELDELVELMTECACATGNIRIHGQEMPAEVVKSRMMKLTSEHIQYVFDCLARTTTKIGNIKAYLLTALYNAPATISHYYGSLVRHNLYGRQLAT